MTTAAAITRTDDVAAALDANAFGATVQVADLTVGTIDAIPLGHTVARRPMHRGGSIVKCGSPIGTAVCAVAHGEPILDPKVLTWNE